MSLDENEIDALNYLMDLKNTSDEDEQMELARRLQPVIDYAETNIHTFCNSIKSELDKNEHCEHINQNNTQQSNQLKVEMQYRYAHKVQVYRQNLEEVFDFPDTGAKITDINNNKNKNKRVHMNYADLHMCPAMMISKPEHFLDDWMVVPCPQGQRTILVAHKGQTKMYSAKGVLVASFSSRLPGGMEYKCEEKLNKYCCVLDCVWLKSNKTIYIKDVLYWCKKPLYYYEAEKRFIFLNHNLRNNTTLLRTIIAGRNDYSIIPLPFQYTSKNISEFLKEYTEITIDKLIFYHRNSLYLKGNTHLVLWLEPFMLPEVLGIQVPQQYQKKPVGYINSREYQSEIYKTEYVNNRVKHLKTYRKEKHRLSRSTINDKCNVRVNEGEINLQEEGILKA